MENKEDNRGWLYVLFDRERLLTKVGISKVPDKRIKAIIAAYPYKGLYEVIRIYLDDYKAVEKTVHNTFEKMRTHSEYFNTHYSPVLNIVFKNHISGMEKVIFNPKFQ